MRIELIKRKGLLRLRYGVQEAKNLSKGIYLLKKLSMKDLSRKDLKKKLDRVFSLYIRLRDSNSNGVVICPLC